MTKTTRPEDFNAAAAFTALDDSCGYSLSDAFTWKLSPQGHGFWEEEDARLEAGKPMTDEAQRILKNWIAESLGFTPAGNAMAAVVEQITPPGEGAGADPLPARALQFGQPQIMQGNGLWDGARYAVDDQD